MVAKEIFTHFHCTPMRMSDTHKKYQVAVYCIRKHWMWYFNVVTHNHAYTHKQFHL